MSAFKYVGQHLDDLHDGRGVEPGQTVELDQEAQESPHNMRLVADGLLLPLPDDDQTPPSSSASKTTEKEKSA